jgi:hypothetical protein
VPAGVRVVVHPARFSHTAMVEAASRLQRDAQSLGEQQVSVQAVGPTTEGFGINVSVVVGSANSAAELDRASALLRTRYGSVLDKVTASEVRASERDLYFGGWRFNDYAPWFGADRIANSSVACTSGFAAVYNRAPVMLTAAHCGGVGTPWWNGPQTGGGYRSVGNTVYSNGHTDVAAISVTSTTNYINVGANPQAATQLYIPRWASPVVGEYLCQSGSFTGEVCGLYVVDTGQSVCLSWFLVWCVYWQGPLADVVNSAGFDKPAAGHGDSGGPVYLRGGSSGTAKGLVHGQLTPNAHARFPAYFPDTLWCNAPEGWMRRCSSGFSFAHMPGF